MRKYLFVLSLLLLLVGCGSPKRQYARYAECTVPVTRDAGMGVRVPGCAAWTFGPNREQRARFERKVWP